MLTPAMASAGGTARAPTLQTPPPPPPHRRQPAAEVLQPISRVTAWPTAPVLHIRAALGAKIRSGAQSAGLTDSHWLVVFAAHTGTEPLQRGGWRRTTAPRPHAARPAESAPQRCACTTVPSSVM